MSFPGFVILLIVFMHCCTELLASVGSEDSLRYQIGFEQELNTYRWLSLIYYERPCFRNGRLRIDEGYNSSLIRLGSNDHKWKKDQQLNIDWVLPISRLWGLKFAVAANQFSDQFSGIVSDIATKWSTVGFRFQPRSKIAMTSAIGYKYDDRQARSDRGATHEIRFVADSVVVKEYENRVHFLTKGDHYAVRNNSDFELGYQMRKYFQEETFDSLFVFWTKKRRDNYELVETDRLNIESYAEENRGLKHYLVYGAPTAIQFRFRTIVNSRETSVAKFLDGSRDEARSKREFHSANEIGMVLERSSMLLDVSLAYEADDQKNEVPDTSRTKKFSKYYYYISPDFSSSRLTLSTRSKWYFFRSDTLQWSGSVSRYRYDTPENNVDDRDELRWNFTITEFHRFSPYLRLTWNGSITLNHLVYIFGERSANNNWMRIFRLFPQLSYQPNKKIQVTHDLEVMANYVDYDFDMGSSSLDLKSYVFRKFSFTQELSAQITNQTGLFLSNRIELEENGKLNWDRWIEYLQMNRETYWFQMHLNFQAGKQFLIAPGWLFSRRIERNQSYLASSRDSGGKIGTMVSYGPTLRFLFAPHKRLNLSFEGMRRSVTLSANQTSYFNHLNLVLSWYN